MEIESIINAITTGIVSGIIAPAFIQLVKKHVPERWRSLFALCFTALTSVLAVVISVLLGWNSGETIDVNYILIKVGAAIAVAQSTYSVVKTLFPGAKDIDIDSLVKFLKSFFGKSEEK